MRSAFSFDLVSLLADEAYGASVARIVRKLDDVDTTAWNAYPTKASRRSVAQNYVTHAVIDSIVERAVPGDPGLARTRIREKRGGEPMVRLGDAGRWCARRHVARVVRGRQQVAGQLPNLAGKGRNPASQLQIHEVCSRAFYAHRVHPGHSERHGVHHDAVDQHQDLPAGTLELGVESDNLAVVTEGQRSQSAGTVAVPVKQLDALGRHGGRQAK